MIPRAKVIACPRVLHRVAHLRVQHHVRQAVVALADESFDCLQVRSPIVLELRRRAGLLRHRQGIEREITGCAIKPEQSAHPLGVVRQIVGGKLDGGVFVARGGTDVFEPCLDEKMGFLQRRLVVPQPFPHRPEIGVAERVGVVFLRPSKLQEQPAERLVELA